MGVTGDIVTKRYTPAQIEPVSILVPLKGNHHRTRHFLRNCVFPQFHYVFADGSLDSSNQRLFSSFVSNNITYLRFPPDTSLNVYLDKMHLAAKEIQTPYVMTMDAGDYLLRDGVQAAWRELDSDPQVAASGSDIFFARSSAGLMSRPYIGNPVSSISGLPTDEALEGIARSYVHLWYTVQRTEAFIDTWRLMSEHELTHPQMEYFPTVAALAKGAYKDTGTPYLIRTVHGPRSWTRQPPDLNAHTQAKAIETQERFAELCQLHFGIESSRVLSAFEKNALSVQRSLERNQFGPDWLARLMPTDEAVRRIPALANLERSAGHYAGLFFAVNQTDVRFSFLTWRSVHRQIQGMKSTQYGR